MSRARFIVLCVLLAGCGGGTVTHREPDEYTGCAGDEQFRIFDDNEKTGVTVTDELAPTLLMPVSGSSVPFSPTPSVRWNKDPAEGGTNDGDVPYMDGPGCMGCCPQFTTGALTMLHLPPLSGDLYDLHFFVGGNDVYRLITTLQEWAAPDALWQSWKGKTVSVMIYRAAVLENGLKQGPYVATNPQTLTVGN